MVRAPRLGKPTRGRAIMQRQRHTNADLSVNVSVSVNRSSIPAGDYQGGAFVSNKAPASAPGHGRSWEFNGMNFGLCSYIQLKEPVMDLTRSYTNMQLSGSNATLFLGTW